MRPPCRAPGQAASSAIDAGERIVVGMFFQLAGKADTTSYLMKNLGVGDAYSARKMKALDVTPGSPSSAPPKV